MIARLALAATLAAFSVPALAAAQIEYFPGAVSKPYRKIFVAPAQVEFDRRFIEDGRTLRGNRGRLRDRDAQHVAGEIGQSMRAALADAFRKRGLEVVAAPAGDALTISPAVKELYMNTPSDRLGSRVVARSAGEAHMVIHGSDAAGTLVLRADKRAAAGESASFQVEEMATNLRAFDDMFRGWAEELAVVFANAR